MEDIKLSSGVQVPIDREGGSFAQSRLYPLPRSCSKQDRKGPKLKALAIIIKYKLVGKKLLSP